MTLYQQNLIFAHVVNGMRKWAWSHTVRVSLYPYPKFEVPTPNTTGVIAVYVKVCSGEAYAVLHCTGEEISWGSKLLVYNWQPTLASKLRCYNNADR